MAGREAVLSTRLLATDTARFQGIAERKGVTGSQLLREIIVDYLEREDRESYAERLAEAESKYAKQLKASTERICSLMAKIGIEVHAVVEFLAMVDGGEAAMAEALSKSSKRIEKGLENQIKRVKEKMSEAVSLED
ncbi:MAG: hypothetical protein QG574_4466 [Cyanobacteriota bacterium erpe_2018_sw_21hr_WHONDRS-SW48-000092_B_bin.40]|nr:hypothetical protein [Cyanobacteriota bacterium erpe_2018_sw_21hr_WHONDRS-SW48-000092_B_bin.40]